MKTVAHWNTLSAVLLFLFVVLTALIFPFIATKFAALYAGFGARLPFITQLFLPSSPIYLLIPVMATMGFAGYWYRLSAGWTVLIFSAGATGLMIPVFFYAMYLPIFQLGAVVVK